MTGKNTIRFIVLAVLFSLTYSGAGPAVSGKDKLYVVTTLPDYAVFAKRIGGERIRAEAIVQGDQDAHFIRPKPSFVAMVRRAGVLVATGLDLELWLPTVVDKAGNGRVRSGQIGYVAAAQGIPLLEKPVSMSRSEGGVHIYGNPHVTCSPVNMRIAAENIAAGLVKNDPGGKDYYRANVKAFLEEIDSRLFGKELVGMLGSRALVDMAEKGSLVDFLNANKYKGKMLVEYLGGWMKEMLPLRGTAIVTYHKNWIYFCRLFGLEEAGTIEPKPGIPPSPRHVNGIVKLMKERQIGIILAANYFDEQKIRTVAGRVNAAPVIVPLYVGGEKGVDDYFMLVDTWVHRLVSAAGAEP
jgi:zinc/manganese transport system substrate-binding protein